MYNYIEDLKLDYGQTVPDHNLFNPFFHESLKLDFFTDFQNKNEVFFKRYRFSHDQFVKDNLACIPNLNLLKESMAVKALSTLSPDYPNWPGKLKLSREINKGLYADNKHEDDYINDSVPYQNEYIDSFIPLRQRAFNLIVNSHATYQNFNSDVYPLLFNMAMQYMDNTSDKYILLQNPYSPYIKAVPYTTRFKGRYLKETNRKLNLEIPFLQRYDKFHFLTITVNPNLYDNIEDAHNDLSNVWNRVWTSIKKRYEHDNFHLYFIKTFEFQHNSYPHIHVLIGGVGYISSKWLRSIKGMNKRWFKSIYLRNYDYKGAFHYILKYIIKNTAYITSENENSTVDPLYMDNDFLKEKIISWSLGMRVFSHSQHIDEYDRRLTNSVKSRVYHNNGNEKYLYNDISNGSSLKSYIRIGSKLKHSKGRFRKKLTFKIRTVMFKHYLKNNSNQLSELDLTDDIVLDFYLDYHNYVFDFIHYKSYWDIPREKTAYLTPDLFDNNSMFAKGRVREYLDNEVMTMQIIPRRCYQFAVIEMK